MGHVWDLRLENLVSDKVSLATEGKKIMFCSASRIRGQNFLQHSLTACSLASSKSPPPCSLSLNLSGRGTDMPCTTWAVPGDTQTLHVFLICLFDLKIFREKNNSIIYFRASFLFFFFTFYWPHSLWDFSSSTRDGTPDPQQ